MKRKFITALTMSILMIFGTASTTFAATQINTQDVQPQKPDNTASTPGNVDIIANVESGYLVEIPAIIDFGKIEKGVNTDQYQISMKLRQKNGINDVKVSMSTDNDYKLYHQITDPIQDVTYIDPNKDAAIGFTFTTNGITNPTKGESVGKLATEEQDIPIGNLSIDTSKINKGGNYKGTIKFVFTGEEGA